MLAIAVLIGFASNYIAISTVSMSVIWPVYYGTTTGNWAGAAIACDPLCAGLHKAHGEFPPHQPRRGAEIELPVEKGHRA